MAFANAIGSTAGRWSWLPAALTPKIGKSIVMPMKAKLVRIGNSRGLRLPKPLIEQAGLQEEVDLEVRGSTIVIRARSTPREGWAVDAARLHARGGDRLVDDGAPTHFDDREWEW